MGETTIEWTDVTWNPVSGCSKVSPGCKNCYAERVFPRAYSHYCRCGHHYDLHCDPELNTDHREPCKACDCLGFQPRKFTDVLTHHDRLEQPLHWKKPRRVFVNSMSDLFHEDVPFEFIDKVFAVMALSPQHTYQILTKRPERMLEYLTLPNKASRLEVSCRGMGMLWKNIPIFEWPLPNVWLGVSVENQQYADERIPLLLQTPAAVRFVSYEPALGPVDFEKVPLPDGYFKWAGVTGVLQPATEKDTEPDDYRYFHRKAMKLAWIIIGGESGPGARPFNLQWARDVIAQCKAAGVAAFFKQGGTSNKCQHDSKGGHFECFDDDLKVREFPR